MLSTETVTPGSGAPVALKRYASSDGLCCQRTDEQHDDEQRASKLQHRQFSPVFDRYGLTGFGEYTRVAYPRRMSTAIDRFRELHESGCFVLPNPWDIGSARLLVHLGFPRWRRPAPDSRGRSAVATITSRSKTRSRTSARWPPRSTCRSTPISKAASPSNRTTSRPTCAARGDRHRRSLDRRLDRRRRESAVRFDAGRRAHPGGRAQCHRSQAAPASSSPARSEGFIAGRPDLGETIRRLTAYADAGADCLYAPGINSRRIQAVVEAVAPKPVNVLAYANFATVAELPTGRSAHQRRRRAGPRRVDRFLAAAPEIAEKGTFTALGHAVSGAEINAYFKT